MKPTICRCCHNSPAPGTTCPDCNLVGERAIAKRDILQHLQQHIGVLHDSYRVGYGPDKGKIVEPAIRLEIRCFEAAIKIVMESRTP